MAYYFSRVLRKRMHFETESVQRFKIIQRRWIWYEWKVRMLLPISHLFKIFA